MKRATRKMSFTIEKGITPPPSKTYQKVEERNEMIKNTVSKMKVGDSFYIPADKFIARPRKKGTGDMTSAAASSCL